MLEMGVMPVQALHSLAMPEPDVDPPFSLSLSSHLLGSPSGTSPSCELLLYTTFSMIVYHAVYLHTTLPVESDDPIKSDSVRAALSG